MSTLSADDQIVAVHDKTLKRYGGPDKPIAKMTYQELQKHEVGRWKDKRFTGEPIPLLTEILKTVPSDKRLFIEIKCGVEIVPHLKKVLQEARPERTRRHASSVFRKMSLPKRGEPTSRD